MSAGGSFRLMLQIYHRRHLTEFESDQMVATRKVCGFAAKDSNIPSVKAYKGAIPPGFSGVEFVPVFPPRFHPYVVQWYDGDPGVSAPDAKGMVCIDVVWIRKVP